MGGTGERGFLMPLSEHEQRLLEQMEKALYAEDPKFATSLRSAPGARAARGRAALGVLGILAGLGLLLAGVGTTIIALGVLGFVVMLVGSVIVYSAFGTRPAEDVASPENPPSQGSAKAPGFMDRMEDRWRRRSDDGPQ